MDSFSLLIDGLGTVFQLDSLLYLFFGTLLGITGGAVPGFASTNTTALVLPLTFIMPAEQALIFIAGIYCGAMYGDAIPAILFHIPGSPGAGATMIDGYPLAQKGKADLALGLSIGASLFGGLLAATITILLIPFMSTFSLKFGPAELFLLIMTAIVIVSTITGSGEARIKGLVAGLLGMLIASVTACPAYGKPRIWFGFYELYEEIPLVACMIGIFALPTIIQFAFKDKIIEADLDSNENKNVGSFKRQFEGIMEVFKRPVAAIRSSLIGWIIGAIPGTGATIATYVSYGQAKMWGKSKKKTDYEFGEGCPDGVIASEAANNAVSSGSLIPTLTLGIPGSGTTAMMLVIFIIHGITPGPSLIRDSGPAVYALLAGSLVAPLMMAPVSIVYNRYSAMLTNLRCSYLLPLLTILCLIGSYAVRYYTFDIYLALIFGLLGLVMHKLRYPVIPFVLGIILGPLAEENLFRVVRLSSGLDIFLSGLGITLMVILAVVTIVAFVVPLFKKEVVKQA
jgi:putative tricarboxylic transport membrane protein